MVPLFDEGYDESTNRCIDQRSQQAIRSEIWLGSEILGRSQVAHICREPDRCVPIRPPPASWPDGPLASSLTGHGFWEKKCNTPAFSDPPLIIFFLFLLFTSPPHTSPN